MCAKYEAKSCQRINTWLGIVSIVDILSICNPREAPRQLLTDLWASFKDGGQTSERQQISDTLELLACTIGGQRQWSRADVSNCILKMA